MAGHPHIVVVGSGIAGLSAAYHVLRACPDARVTLVEAAASLGGHSLTLAAEDGDGDPGSPFRPCEATGTKDTALTPALFSAALRGGEQAAGLKAGDRVDVGFQVMNAETYPGLVRAYEELGVELVPTDMSFSVSVPSGEAAQARSEVKFGPALGNLWRWLRARPADVLGFILSKRRLHADAWEFLSGARETCSLAQLQRSGPGGRRYHAALYERWLLPFVRAVWSSGHGEAEDMDAATLLPFLRNHGFLTWGTVQWLTPRHGARAEVRAFGGWLRAHGAAIRPATVVTALRQRADGRVDVCLAPCTAGCGEAKPAPAPGAAAGETLVAEAVISCGSADSLREMAGAGALPLPPPLRAAGGAFRTCAHRVVVHRDPRVMPADRAAWASWNVVRLPDGLAVTYWLRSLQPVADDRLFVTLDPPPSVDASAVWERRMAHPQMVRGVHEAQEAVAAWNWRLPGPGAGPPLFVAGAWTRHGFHEDGFRSGSLAARCALRFLGRAREADSVPVLRVASAAQSGPCPCWHYSASTFHRAAEPGAAAAEGHSFRYDMPGVVAVDLECAPAHWWGGFRREDHWGDPRTPLLHAVADEIAAALPGRPYPAGPVDCVTTLRAFGRCFNPISVLVAWADPWRQRPLAFCLEVTNTPWEERALYVVDARGADVDAATGAATLRRAFRKTLHVSPFHAHPRERAQHYVARFAWVPSALWAARAPEGARARPPAPAPPALLSALPPFESLDLNLSLFEGDPPAADDDAPAGKPTFVATWKLRAPELRHPSPAPVAFLTLYRIMRQALTLHKTGRDLHANVTNPAAPIDAWMVAFGVVAASVLHLGSLHLLPYALPLFGLLPRLLRTLFAHAALGAALFAARAVPAGRDMLIGWCIAVAALLV